MATTSLSLPKTRFELEFNQGSEYGDADLEAIQRVFAARAPSCGPEVLAFEKEFAALVHTKYGIAVSNATQGLEIAVRAVLGDGRDEVIVPAISWISTASAAVRAGAGRVRFADVVSPTLCVDIASVKRLVTTKTAAVLVVHLFGRPVDGVTELATWLKAKGVALIEDCAHAVDAHVSSDQRCGSIGDIGVFSFHQQKNMTTLGEGGMCTTSDDVLREKMVGFRSLCAASYDPKGKYLAIDPKAFPMGNRFWLMDFSDQGSNYRMLDMQAAVGRAQLLRVRGWNDKRRAIAQALHAGLSSLEREGFLLLPPLDVGLGHAWHVFHVLIGRGFPLSKEQFMWRMYEEFGIKCWNHYSPMHLSSSFRKMGWGARGDCPTAEALFEEYVSLPIHPRLTEEAVAHMIDAVRQLAGRQGERDEASPTPLLDALLALSSPSSSPSSSSSSPSSSASASDPAESHWASFRPLIQQHADLFSLAPATTSTSSTTNTNTNTNTSSGSSSGSRGSVFVTRAPGRLDLMGGNDDYTGGLVFECTIAEATLVAAAQRRREGEGEALVVIRNPQLSQSDVVIPASLFLQDSFGPSQLAAYVAERFSQEGRWPLYVTGVLLWLAKRHPSLVFANNTGLSLLIWSDVPLNRGVSSSASVEVAVMKAAAHAFGVEMSGTVLATACQWAEINVCSSACGLMDQMAVTVGGPFMAMKCQPAQLLPAPPLPADLTVYALDSGVSHEVSGIEYEAARAAAFMGYKIICAQLGLPVTREEGSGGATDISRYTDPRFNGYLANLSPSQFMRSFEQNLPERMTGAEFLASFGDHVDPATPLLPAHSYAVRANTKYAVLENNRVTLFFHLLQAASASASAPTASSAGLYQELGELMYQSHDAYTECGLGSSATSKIVELVRSLGPASGLFGAKITGGGAGGTVAVLGLRSAAGVFSSEVVAPYALMRGEKGQPQPHVFSGSSLSADLFGVRTFDL